MQKPQEIKTAAAAVGHEHSSGHDTKRDTTANSVLGVVLQKIQPGFNSFHEYPPCKPSLQRSPRRRIPICMRTIQCMLSTPAHEWY